MTFPAWLIDSENGKISFRQDKFEREIDQYSLKMAEPDGLALGEGYAGNYRRFLEKDLAGYPAIHGQVTGPVNLGFRINDESGKPIIYDDNIRGLLFDFIQRKFNIQYRQLREKNRNAFVWLDEPGLIWVFSGLSGYNDIQAKRDYARFLTGLDGLKGLHLCSNINLPYLLELGTGLVSFDAYQMEVMPRDYAASVARFLREDGIISWGIVPTEPLQLQKETPDKLAELLLGYWEVVARGSDLTVKEIAGQALLAPAKCCVKSAEFSSGAVSKAAGACPLEETAGSTAEEESVARAYGYLKELSGILKEKFGL